MAPHTAPFCQSDGGQAGAEVVLKALNHEADVGPVLKFDPSTSELAAPSFSPVALMMHA